jgi:predicted AAA+ superfamily ATPase
MILWAYEGDKMSIINEENVLKLLYSYNPWWKMGFVQKELNKPIKRFAFYEVKKRLLHKDLRRAVLLSGARRTGKTTIMYQIISELISTYNISPKNILFVSFDHPLLKMYSIDAMLNVYKQNISGDNNIYCFFDEIQYAEDWDKWIKILYDTIPEIKIVATGSASPILKDKATESGLGRWSIVPVPTLSFYEYCNILGLEKPDLPKRIKPTQIYLLPQREQADIFMKLSKFQAHFVRYLQVGGFPELALSSDDIYAQRMLREDIVDKAIKRDLPAVYGIRNISDIEKIFLYLCYKSSKIISIDAISRELNGVSRATVERYIDHLESANLIYISSPINVTGKKILKKQNKIYISDAAMRSAVLLDDDLTASSEELGVIVETAVYKHIKTFYYTNQATVGYYRESDRGKEIDIVVHALKSPLIMIEVKYRETSEIKENDAIVTMAKNDVPNLVVTKRDMDFGRIIYGDKSIYKIPAYAFLYLLGKVEEETYN